MKHIYRKISLEQFKSRLPSIVTAYYNFGQFYEFDGKTEFDDYIKKPSVNYGLIPFFVKWDSGIYKNTVISFFTLSKWYHFLEFYIKLLNQNNCAMTIINNAYEYYISSNEPKYSLEECLDFDQKIINICGESESNLIAAQNKLAELENSYFPKFKIDEKLQYVWNKKTLSLNEVKYWIQWFTERKDEYDSLDDCKLFNNSNDCCDCNEFFKLGGKDMLKQLIEFVKNLKFPEDKFKEPYLSFNILITNKIDDLGEFSILAEPWNEGVDYSSSLETSNGIITSGAVVSYNGNEWVLENGKGYIHSEKFKENYFGSFNGMTEQEKLNYQDEDQDLILTNNKQFARLIEKNINNNINFNKKEHYIYGYDNKKYFYDGDLKDNKFIINKVFKNYEIKENKINMINYGFFYFNGNIININIGDFVEYNENVYLVFYDNSNNPVININGIIYYGIFNDEGKYIFQINNEPKEIKYNQKYIIIQKTIFLVNDDLTVTINNIIYSRIPYYSIIDGVTFIFNDNYEILNQILKNNKLEYVKDDLTFGKKISLDEINNTTYGYVIDNNFIFIITPYVEYDTNLITGYTESKLSTFLSATDVMYDNLGNKLSGSIESDSIHEGDILGLLYKSKTMVHATKHQNPTNLEQDLYWCDFLDTIEIFYEDNSNNLITHIYYLSNLNKDFEGNLNDILQELDGELLINNVKIHGNLKARFTYYMGCDLVIEKKDNVLNYNIINQGIKYIEKLSLSQKEQKYFIDNYTYYTLKYYDLNGEKINYKNSTYNYSSTVNKAYFILPVTKFINGDNFNDNGWVSFPLCKEEYKIGSSSLENVQSDIYINRGTAKSFDNHLRLMEVNSLESLEQYGNGFFKIITN